MWKNHKICHIYTEPIKFNSGGKQIVQSSPQNVQNYKLMRDLILLNPIRYLRIIIPYMNV